MKGWHGWLLAAALVAGGPIGCLEGVDSGGPLLGGTSAPLSSYDYEEERWRREEAEWRERERQYGKQRDICAKVEERIRHDQRELAKIDPGRKAAQWYRDDIQNALRDRERCRHEFGGGRGWERERDDWQRRRDEAHRRGFEERERQRDRVREHELERQRAAAQAQQNCFKHRERIRTAQRELAKIDPKRKAAQWYRDDMRNAERDMQRDGCR